MGFILIESFFLDGQIPTWTFALGDALIEKKIWMEPNLHITSMSSTLYLEPHLQISIKLKYSVNLFRFYHSLTKANGWKMDISLNENELKVLAFEGAHPFTVKCDQGSCSIDNIWYGNYYLSMEKQRGLDYREDHLLGLHIPPKFKKAIRQWLRLALKKKMCKKTL